MSTLKHELKALLVKHGVSTPDFDHESFSNDVHLIMEREKIKILEKHMLSHDLKDRDWKPHHD